MVDQEIFEKNKNKKIIQDYLKNPYDFIAKKYESFYKPSWENL
jgi:hypothetical protein